MEKVLDCLYNNIEITDIHIEEVVNKFLEFLGKLSEEDAIILQSNSEIIALKLPKLGINILTR